MHSESIRGLAFKPGNGELLATASADTTVKLWEVASGPGHNLCGHD